MIDKLRSQIKEQDKNIYLIKIVECIEKKAEINVELSELLETSDRTLEDCWKYILDCARKEAKNNCACIEDDVVYEWAIKFYHMTDEEYKKPTEKPKPKKKPNDSPKEVKPSTLPEVAEPKRDMMMEPKKKDKKDETLEGQTNIFDFLGV